MHIVFCFFSPPCRLNFIVFNMKVVRTAPHNRVTLYFNLNILFTVMCQNGKTLHFLHLRSNGQHFNILAKK